MSPRWQFFPSAAGDDWDTVPRAGLYAANTSHTQGTGITYRETNLVFNSFRQTGSAMEPYQLNWASADNLSLNMDQTVNTNSCALALPYCAYWNSTSQKWRKGVAVARGTFKSDMIYSGMSDLSYNIMDDNPCAFIIFASDPGSVAGWRNYDGPLQYTTRQEITYTLVNTGWTSMTVSNSSGDAILTDQVISWPPQAWSNPTAANTGPRFLMGSYTSGYTNAQVTTLWNSLRIEYSINGGTRTLLGEPVSISSNQTSYINSGDSLNNTSALGVGDTITYFVSDI